MGKPASINPNPCFQHSTQIPLCIHFWKWRKQIWQNALASPLVSFQKMQYNTIHAVLESTRIQRMYIERGELAPFKAPGGISINITKTSRGWSDSIDSAS